MYIQWQVLYIYNIVFLIVYYRGYAFAEDGVSLRSGGPAVFPMSAGAFPMKKGSVAPTEPEIRVRRIFPETWLWQMLETGQAV